MRVELDVRVRASVQKRLQQLEVLGLLVVVRARLRVVGLGRPVGLENREQRGDAVGVGGAVRVGAALDQLHGQVELAVEDGHQKRAGAVAADLVDVGPAVQQGEPRFDVPLARGVQQRGHAAGHADQGLPVGRARERRAARVVRPVLDEFVGVEVLPRVVGEQELPLGGDRLLHLRGGQFGFRAGFGLEAEPLDAVAQEPAGLAVDGHVAQHVHDPGCQIRVRAMLQEHLNGRRPVVGGREHQRGLADGALARVHVGTVLQ